MKTTEIAETAEAPLFQAGMAVAKRASNSADLKSRKQF
jgi:hypothetical protein